MNNSNMDTSIISAIIIDDESNAINLLEVYLRRFPSIQVIGKETEAKKGLELIKEKLPELVFLDIDMPDMDGLMVANIVQTENLYSEIVFTTAHQHYAYEALDIKPLDFLTKPFCIADIELVLQKYNDKIIKKKQEKKLDTFINFQNNSAKTKLPTTNGIIFVEIKNIVLFKSKLNNCEILMEDGTTETITRNLYKVVSILNSPAFFQISRSTYINMNYLQRVDKKSFKCIISVNQIILEEPITKSCMIIFEKMIKFPFSLD